MRSQCIVPIHFPRLPVPQLPPRVLLAAASRSAPQGTGRGVVLKARFGSGDVRFADSDMRFAGKAVYTAAGGKLSIPPPGGKDGRSELETAGVKSRCGSASLF